MNLSLLKSYKLWIAVIVSVLGVLMSQGVVVDGSTAAQVIGWILTFVGAGAGGAHVGAQQDPQA